MALALGQLRDTIGLAGFADVTQLFDIPNVAIPTPGLVGQSWIVDAMACP